VGAICVAKTIFSIILLIFFYGAFIFTYFYPVESLLLGRRWQFKEEPRFSNGRILFTKYLSIIGIFVLTIISVRAIFDSYFLSNLLIIILIFYIIIRGYKLLSK
jgi:hypothetical protein